MFVASFIKHVEVVTWLSPIVVVFKKNKKLKICVDFKKLNVATKKDSYPLLFTNEIIYTIAIDEVYTFLDGFFGYHHISIASKEMYKITFVNDWGAFCMGCDACLLGSKMDHPPIKGQSPKLFVNTFMYS